MIIGMRRIDNNKVTVYKAINHHHRQMHSWMMLLSGQILTHEVPCDITTRCARPSLMNSRPLRNAALIHRHTWVEASGPAKIQRAQKKVSFVKFYVYRMFHVALDSSHPSHSFFSLIQSGRRDRRICARTSLLRDNFFPAAMRLVNEQ